MKHSERYQNGYRTASDFIKRGKTDELEHYIKKSKDFDEYDDFDRGAEQAIRDYKESQKK